jgi:CheY-like chemotaxis protein
LLGDAATVAEQQVVLIVDDDPAVREMLALVIGDETGRPVVLARDGLEAVGRALDSRPAVVVLDMRLPGLDGEEVARRLKADPRTAGAEIVAVSASADPHAAFAAGCDYFVAKPFDLDELLLVVETALVRTNPLAIEDRLPVPGRARRCRGLAAS